MPSNDRALYHITDPVTEITRGAPSSSEGSDGDKRFAYIPDRGLYHFVKHSGKWHSSAVYQEDISPLTKNGLQTENLTSKHDIRMAPARNVEIKEKKSMGTGEFTQGFTGNGWRLRHVDNEYNLEVDSMTVRGTLHVFEMLIQQLRATNGTVIIASAAKADSATSTTITFDDPSDHGVCPFAVNDIVMCQRVNLNSTTVVKRIVRRVTAVNGATITVVRDGDLPGDTATVVKGDDFVRIGNTTNTSRQGGVLLTADMTNAPFIEIFDNVSSWATWTATDKIKARLGQLKGITDADANLDDETKFGLYTNDVNLKGHLFSQSGEIAGWTLGNTTISKNNTELSSAGTLTLGTSSDIIKLSSIDSTYRIWAGHTSGASANFSVEKDGTLYATGATISGAITITGGNAETTTGSQTKATAAQVAATAAAATDATSKADAAEAAAEAAASSDATSKAAAAEAAAKAASLLRASYLTSNTTTINGGTITTGSIAADRIAANSITADQINTSNITAAVVTSTSVNATDINADNITAGTLDAARVTAVAITSGSININNAATIDSSGNAVFSSVTATGQIVSNSGSSSWTDGSLTGGSIGGSSIESGRIVIGSVGAGQLELVHTGDTSTTWLGVVEGGSGPAQTPWRILANGNAFFQYDAIQMSSGQDLELLCNYPTGGIANATALDGGLILKDMSEEIDETGKVYWKIKHGLDDANLMFSYHTIFGSETRAFLEATGDWVIDGYVDEAYSDVRLKTNLVPMSNSLDRVMEMKPYDFDWVEERGGEHDTGLIAQDMLEMMPEIVSKGADQIHYTIRYKKLIPTLINAIQELQQEVEGLKNAQA